MLHRGMGRGLGVKLRFPQGASRALYRGHADEGHGLG